MKIKVRNMEYDVGNKVANQFIIEIGNVIFFQSYDSIIAKKDGEITYLDNYYWDYSATTVRYRNLFLNMDTKEVIRAIDSGEIKLVNLN